MSLFSEPVFVIPITRSIWWMLYVSDCYTQLKSNFAGVFTKVLSRTIFQRISEIIMSLREIFINL